MEQIIIIGLLIIIVLILLDRKFSINIQGKDCNDANKNLPSFMGGTKQLERQALPIDVNGGQNESILLTEDNFESETRKEEFGSIDPTKNLNDILTRDNDWEQEDEDWKYENSTIESGFATGVTFQELSTAGQLLQQDVLEPDLEQQTVDIIQKIQGTELFDLLENSLGDASRRIAALLSESISNDDNTISSKHNNSADGFDIGEFV
ncbi:hypothetical protein SAMN06265171_105197 [Chryseobacterium rhizoplanae]|uniref:Conjugal transfer protein TraD n=1 Tax=Chryseobacterium rhizoplanae TaxID=1609531 RepID=A0A521DKB5_9FLAO|nr:hypothetical protein [Chryseobacterium rhizoplanae]SMO72058.1 hypothetical protein SAMN06265171_105197 [Chryseobacterium rhizoplanae]